MAALLGPPGFADPGVIDGAAPPGGYAASDRSGLLRAARYGCDAISPG